MRGFISNAKSKRAASVFDEHHDCAKALGEKHEPPFCNVMGGDFEASGPGGLRGLSRRLSQMSGTVTALDEVTCSGNCGGL